MSVGIVPDGVTRVKWTFTGAGYGVLDPHPVSLAPLVRGNVAVAPVRPGQGPLASAVWYDAGGKVIASAGAGAESKRELEQIDAVNASRDRPIAPELVAHYRLFRSISPVDLARNPVLPTLGGRQGDLDYWQTRYIGSVSGLDASWVMDHAGHSRRMHQRPERGGMHAAAEQPRRRRHPWRDHLQRTPDDD